MVIRMKYRILIALSCFTVSTINCRTKHKIIPDKVGNFANLLKPVTNFGLGQNIAVRNSFTPYLSVTQQKGDCENLITLSPQLLYGITDYFSLLISIPIIVKFDENCLSTKGFGDMLAQLEYAFYEHYTKRSRIWATIVANMTLPTGSKPSRYCEDKLATGFGASSFLIGGTASYLGTMWYSYLSGSATFVTARQGMKGGDIFFYEFGGGGNLGNPGGITMMALLEFNGILTKKNKTDGYFDENTGGNIIYLGPSLYASHGRWVIEGGVQFPVFQHLNGTQAKQKFRTLFIGAIRF